MKIEKVDKGKRIGGKKYSRNIGTANSKVIFTSITVTPKVKERDPYSIKKPVYDEWQNFVNEQRKLAPKGMKNFHQTSEAWIYMPTELEFRNSAI